METKMRLTVHIGTTKTGSKSIQRFLVRNRAQLASDGLLIPKSLGNPINVRAVLASIPFGFSAEIAKTIPITDKDSYDRFRVDTVREFDSEVSSAYRCRETIITAELLHSRLTRQEYVEEFKSLFCGAFDDVRIIVYVRPQLDHIISLYSTVLRNGYKVTMNEFLRSHITKELNPYFDLKDVITRWVNVFGTEGVTVRPYMALRSGLGTLGDFCQYIGIDIEEDRWVVSEPRNMSINPAGQELLLMLNRDPGLEPARRREVVEWAERNMPGPGVLPDVELANEFEEMFTDSNNWVVNKYFPDHPEFLVSRSM